MALIIHSSSSVLFSHGEETVPPQKAFITEVSVPETVQPGESFSITITFSYNFPLFPEYDFPIYHSLMLTFDSGTFWVGSKDKLLVGEGFTTFSFDVTAPMEDAVLRITPEFVYYNIALGPDFDSEWYFFDGEPFDIHVGDIDQSPLSLTTNVLHLYPTTGTNETTLEYTHETQNLDSIVQFSIRNSPPSGIDVTIDPAEVTNTGGVSEIKISVSLDNSNSLTFPSEHIVTILAKSGETEETIDLTLQLKKPEWLIMVYLAADTDPDLQDSMIGNINELLAATNEQNPKIGITALVDLRADATIAGTSIKKNNAMLFQVLNGELVQIGADWGPTDMSSSSVLRKFITEAQELIPSEHTHLILGDHGGGYLNGIVSDHHQKSGWMSISDFVSGLGDSKFDIISFDACHMGQFEVVYPLKNCAKYLTVSELEMPGPGYNYKAFLLGLMNNPDVAVEDYVKSIIGFHEEKYDEVSDGKEITRYGKSSTLSAIDTSKLESLKTGIESLGKALSASYQTEDESYLQAVKRIQWNFNIKNNFRVANFHHSHIDLKHYALQLIDKTSNAGVTNAANALIEAFDETIIANTGNLFETLDKVKVDTPFNGLLVVLPAPNCNMRAVMNAYDKTEFPSQMPEWYNYLKDHYATWKKEPYKNIRIKLDHPEHQLYPHVYDSQGNHVGYDPSLIEYSRTQIACEINGSEYIDYGNGTKIIDIPSGMGEFTFMVDGSKMEEDSEAYTLTYSFFTDGEVTFTETVTGIILYDTSISTSIIVDDTRLLIEQISSNGDAPASHTAYLLDVSAPTILYTEESATIELTIYYDFPEPTPVNPGIYDSTTSEWIVDEYYTLEGTGTITYEYTITAASTPLDWELEASVWYYLEDEWTYDEEKYSEAFEISVVEEEENGGGGGIPGFPYLAIALGLTFILVFRERFLT